MAKDLWLQMQYCIAVTFFAPMADDPARFIQLASDYLKGFGVEVHARKM